MLRNLSGRKNFYHLVILLIFLFFSFSSWFQKIGNFDFWWHIKTGEYIFEHRALPDKDPFTYTYLENDRDEPETPAVVLKSYWLSQVILFLIFKSTGPLGIILLKILVLALTLMILWKYMTERSASLILSFAMFSGLVIFVKDQIAERPQIFSFLFAAIVFYLLEEMREEYTKHGARCKMQDAGQEDSRCSIQDKELLDKLATDSDRASRLEKRESWIMDHGSSFMFLPLVMLLWANMHRGYMVGMAFISAYLAVMLFKTLSGRSQRLPLLICAISLLIIFINPVTYHPLTSFISWQSSTYRNEAFEFNSPLSIIPFLNSNWYPFFALLIVSGLIVVSNLASRIFVPGPVRTSTEAQRHRDNTGRLPIEHLLLLVGTAAASLISVRYAMFFMIVAVPAVTLYLSRRFRIGIPEGLKKGIVAVLSLTLLILSFRSPLFTQPKDELIDSRVVPAEAVEFIRQRSLPANILNDVNWGGYLIWKLYPEFKVFSDTRALNLEIYRQYLSILHANETMYMGKPEWKALLDMYSINTIIHSAVNPYSGEVWPLMLKLLNDGEWRLVYADGLAIILARRVTGNVPELPKSMLLEEIRIEASRGLQRLPGHPGFLRTLNMVDTLEKQ